MILLTFIAQLSLDFIFTGVKRLPGAGEEILAEGFDLQLGGGPLAYPIVLSRLGIPTRVLVKTSPTLQSKFALEVLAKYPISEVVTFEETNYEPLMLTAVISMNEDRSFVSKNDEAALLFADSIVEEYYLGSKVVFASKEIQHLLKKFKERGSIIVFDVGWSDDLDLKDYIELLKDVDYFTPNDKEALKMTGSTTVEESLEILAQYVKYPIVSCGKDGCKAMIDKEVVHVPIPQGIEAIDLTGAGDNFMAGLIYGIYMDIEPYKCLQLANCTGALSTIGLGCYGNQYTLDDVMRLMDTYNKR